VMAVVALASGDAGAQSINVDLGQPGGTVSGQIIRLVLLVTVLSLAPSILVMVTSFTRIVIVLSILRTAIGLQQTPPNSVLVGLALFLTAFVMSPTFEAVYRDGLEPLLAEEIDETEALDRAGVPVRAFMLQQVRADDVALFVEIAGSNPRPLGAAVTALTTIAATRSPSAARLSTYRFVSASTTASAATSWATTSLSVALLQ